MEERYDENIADNPFFNALKRDFPHLYYILGKSNAQLCVPKSSVLCGESIWSEDDFRHHILVGGESGELKTLSDKEIKLDSESLIINYDEPNEFRIPILFEETFVSDSGTFQVLCIDAFLTSEPPVATRKRAKSASTSFLPPDQKSSLDSLDCFELILFRTTPNGPELKERVVKMLLHFGDWLVTQFRPFGHYSPAQLAEVISQQFRSTWDFIRYHRVEMSSDVVTERQLELLKTGTEIFFFHHLHKPIWSILTSMMIEPDGHFNKQVCDADSITVESLGIDSYLYESIPAARDELNLLNDEVSPHAKIIRLRKIIQTVWKGVKGQNVLTPDSLLPVLIFLILKSPIRNWISNLEYIRQFHFCQSADLMNELGYCCASFEAAANYIESTTLQKLVMDKFIPDSSENLSADPFAAVSDSESTELSNVWELLLLAIKNDSDEEVQKIFGPADDAETQGNSAAQHNGEEVPPLVGTEVDERDLESASPTKCHPLCDCQRCRPMNSGQRLYINATLKGGRTALHMAAFLGKSSVLNSLCELGANPESRDAAGQTPLHYACASPSSSQKCVLLLLHHGAKSSSMDMRGNTPLHLAVWHKNIDCAKAIIFYNPHMSGTLEMQLDQKNNQGDTPLHLAARMRYYELVELLLQNGAKTTLYNRKGEKAVDYAEETAVLISLFHKKFDQTEVRDESTSLPSLQTSSSDTIMEGFEAAEDSLETTQRKRLLISDAMDESLMRRFMRAISDNDYPMVKFYLDRSTSAATGRCHPLCQCSACNSEADGTKEHTWIDINSTYDDILPLHLACSVPASLEIVNYLVESGAEVSVRCGSRDSTALHLSAQFGAPLEVINLLIGKGAKVDETDVSGKTPLHFAAEYAGVSTVKILLEHGAKVNDVDRSGNSPLHYASKGGNPDVINLLISSGADVEAQNDLQLTAADISQEKTTRRLLNPPRH